MSPYVEINYGKVLQSTQEDVKGATEPTWNETFEFDHDKDALFIDFLVMEKGRKEIAKGRFSLLSLSAEELSGVAKLKLYRNFDKASRSDAGILSIQVDFSTGNTPQNAAASGAAAPVTQAIGFGVGVGAAADGASGSTAAKDEAGDQANGSADPNTTADTPSSTALFLFDLVDWGKPEAC